MLNKTPIVTVLNNIPIVTMLNNIPTVTMLNYPIVTVLNNIPIATILNKTPIVTLFTNISVVAASHQCAARGAHISQVYYRLYGNKSNEFGVTSSGMT
jgi:hypothetical protein